VSLSFLKKLGVGIAKGVAAADAVADRVPFIKMVPGVSIGGDLLDLLAGVIVQTEAIGKTMKAPGP